MAFYHGILPWYLQKSDLVHSVGNVACLLTRKPQVVTVHDLCQKIVPQRFSRTKRIYLEFGLKRTAARNLEIICDSENTRRDLTRFYPEASPRAHVVHCACKFSPNKQEVFSRKDFLFVGTLEPGKNLDSILRALCRLRDEYGLVARLKVVGAKGWKQSHIAPLIRELQLEETVDFLGYLTDADLRAQYKSALCLVFPSSYEGFGFPLLEAQSQGCPVISADNSCLREVGGEGCHYFQDGHMDQLVELMRYCLERNEAFSSICAAGFENCERFSWEKSAELTLEVYRLELEKRKRPAHK